MARVMISPAGSGKTRRIIESVQFEVLGGAASHDLLLLSFTQKAVGELKARLDANGIEARVMTIHGWAAVVCRENASAIGRGHDFTVLSELDELEVYQAAATDLGLGTHKTIEQVKRAAGKARCASALQGTIGRVMAQQNAMTLDGVQAAALRLLEAGCVRIPRFVWIDEYQDVCPVQEQIAWRLDELASLTVVGDPSQAIYGWRGAVPTALSSLADRPGSTVERRANNFRSDREIVAAANRLARQFGGVVSVATSKAPGRVVLHEHESEVQRDHWLLASIRPDEDSAIIARTWSDLSRLHNMLDDHDIPHSFTGSPRSFRQSPAVLWLVAGMRWSSNHKDTVALRRLLSWPNPANETLMLRAMRGHAVDDWRIDAVQCAARGCVSAWCACVADDAHEAIGDDAKQLAMAADALAAWARRNGVSSIDDVLTAWCEPAGDCLDEGLMPLRLSSVHGMKGREADIVHIIGLEAGFWPVRGGDEEHAMRCLYVAATRARRQLHVHVSRSRFRFGKRLETMPSPWAYLIAPEGEER